MHGASIDAQPGTRRVCPPTRPITHPADHGRPGLHAEHSAGRLDRPPEALTGQLKRSITAMSITIYGWTTRQIVDRLTPSSRVIEATLLPGAAAQVAGMITASRAGNPPGSESPARTVAGEGNGRDVARGAADPRNRSRPGRLGVRDRLRGDHGAGAVAGSTAGASLRRGRGAWRFRGGRNRRAGGVPPSGQDRSHRVIALPVSGGSPGVSVGDCWARNSRAKTRRFPR